LGSKVSTLKADPVEDMNGKAVSATIPPKRFHSYYTAKLQGLLYTNSVAGSGHGSDMGVDPISY